MPGNEIQQGLGWELCFSAEHILLSTEGTGMEETRVVRRPDRLQLRTGNFLLVRRGAVATLQFGEPFETAIARATGKIRQESGVDPLGFRAWQALDVSVRDGACWSFVSLWRDEPKKTGSQSVLWYAGQRSIREICKVPRKKHGDGSGRPVVWSERREMVFWALKSRQELRKTARQRARGAMRGRARRECRGREDGRRSQDRSTKSSGPRPHETTFRLASRSRF